MTTLNDVKKQLQKMSVTHGRSHQTTYWIPGNHEYYQSDISNRSGSFEEQIRSNVLLANNVIKKFGTHQVIFSTLWSSISLLNGWRIERGLNDFYQISFNGRRFQIPNYNDFHANCLTFLRGALETDPTGKKVVITHHVPTFKNYPLNIKETG